MNPMGRWKDCVKYISKIETEKLHIYYYLFIFVLRLLLKIKSTKEECTQTDKGKLAVVLYSRWKTPNKFLD